MCFSPRKRLKRSVGALGCVSIGAVDGLSREVRETFLAFTNSLFSDREFMSFLGFLVFFNPRVREFIVSFTNSFCQTASSFWLKVARATVLPWKAIIEL